MYFTSIEQCSKFSRIFLANFWDYSPLVDTTKLTLTEMLARSSNKYCFKVYIQLGLVSSQQMGPVPLPRKSSAHDRHRLSTQRSVRWAGPMSVKPFPLSVARQFPGRGHQVWTTGHQNRKPKSQIMIERQEVNLELLPSPRWQTHCTTSPSLKAGSASSRNPGRLLETEPEVRGEGETPACSGEPQSPGRRALPPPFSLLPLA